MKKLLLIITVLVALALAFFAGTKFNQISLRNEIEEPITNIGAMIDPDYPNQVVCTDDAKQCDDGSYVGRSGLNCEFTKCPGIILPHLEDNYEEPIGIQLPTNVISEKDCIAQGGEIWNTLGETSYDGELLGRVDGLRCPCACLVRAESSDILWVDIDGNIEEFKGDINDIQTYDDCKNAGFAIKDGEPKICTVGKPYMTDGLYKTFYNNPMEDGLSCTDYHYSTCPGSCVAICASSHCSEPDENGNIACTSDCDGPGSCIE